MLMGSQLPVLAKRFAFRHVMYLLVSLVAPELKSSASFLHFQSNGDFFFSIIPQIPSLTCKLSIIGISKSTILVKTKSQTRTKNKAFHKFFHHRTPPKSKKPPNTVMITKTFLNVK